MPELTERKLLCRTCNGEEYRFTHLPSAPAGYHPFDGVPYVPCPECADGAVIVGLPTSAQWPEPCPSCGGSGWVREEA